MNDTFYSSIKYDYTSDAWLDYVDIVSEDVNSAYYRHAL